MASKEFLKWKEKIEVGNSAILFVGTTNEYVRQMKDKLVEEYGIYCNEGFDWEDKEMHEPMSEYTIEIVRVEKGLALMITMGITKDLAKEFKDYQSKRRKLKKDAISEENKSAEGVKE